VIKQSVLRARESRTAGGDDNTAAPLRLSTRPTEHAPRTMRLVKKGMSSAMTVHSTMYAMRSANCARSGISRPWRDS
jgi:hypothetical protein